MRRTMLFLSLAWVVLFAALASLVRAAGWDQLKRDFLASQNKPERVGLLADIAKVDNPDAVALLLEMYFRIWNDERNQPLAGRITGNMNFADSFAGVLGGYKSPETVQALIEAGLRSKYPPVASLAARAFEISRNPAALEPLCELLANTRLDRQVTLDSLRALGAIGDAKGIDALKEFSDRAKSWETRLALVEACRGIGSIRAVSILLPLIGGDQSLRVRSTALKTLVEITGQNFHGNQSMWTKWYDENKQAIEDGSMAKGSLRKAPDEGSTTYHGLPLESDRLIFVMDVSNSMLKPYEAPKDNDPAAAQAGDVSKLDIAKSELINVLENLPDGASVALIFFHRQVLFWREEMTTLNAKSRADAINFVKKLATAQGTNVFGGLEKLFEVAGALDKKGKPVVVSGTMELAADTIYMLSDGKPVGGRLTEPEEILKAVASFNRGTGIIINTVFIGSEKGEEFMRDLAAQNHGTFVHR